MNGKIEQTELEADSKPGANAGKNFEHLVKKHPCFNPDAHQTNGRIHLPVSPACNIQCRFCKRNFNKIEERPGVTRKIVSPEEAVEIVAKALTLCPQITVAGVAGPGDSLATDHALNTFRLIKKRFPEILFCMSTNGLMLEEKVDEIVDVGIRTVTVTVNAVDPAILSRICGQIVYEGRIVRPPEASEILIRKQLAGIRKASSKGIIIKINMVLIPGINDGHVEEVAEKVLEARARLMNILPLIPQYEFSEFSPPDCGQITKARIAAEKHLRVFKHCKHCRADACGIPGISDFADKLYESREETFSHG